MHLPYAVAAHEFVLRNSAVAIPIDGIAQKRGKLLQPAFINHRPPVDLVHGRKQVLKVLLQSTTSQVPSKPRKLREHGACDTCT